MINWLRANATLSGTSLFGSAAQPNYNNIHQGALGDCYYLSSLAAVAEVPKRIQNIFLTPTYNKAGIFAVTVYVRGKPIQVVVDDQLPFYYGSNLIFDHVQAGEGIWAAILEKAWAKVNGNYDVTSGGWMNEAVGFLTGVPSLGWSNTDANTVNSTGVNAWNIIKPATDANYIMTASVGNKCGSDSSYSAYHLPCGHAYTLLGAYSIKNSAGVITNRLL